MSEEQAIRRAWGDLCWLAHAWDWTGLRMLNEAEKAVQRDARNGATNYPKIEQLAGLCGSAVKPRTTLSGLYQLPAWHRDVMIVAAAMTERFPDEMADWRAEHGAAIGAFRAAALADK